jgi:hypothetical protein
MPEQFVVNSNAGDAINGKVFDSYADAVSAIRNEYGDAEVDRLQGLAEGEPETEIVPL